MQNFILNKINKIDFYKNIGYSCRRCQSDEIENILDSKSSAVRLVGASPTSGTEYYRKYIDLSLTMPTIDKSIYVY